MKELVIDRSMWRRAGTFTNEPTQLLNADGHMCCLGFYMRACRVPKRKILEVSFPTYLESELPKQAEWLGESNDQIRALSVERELTSINDDATVSPQERERKIKRVFRTYGGVAVRFVGRTPSTPSSRKESP